MEHSSGSEMLAEPVSDRGRMFEALVEHAPDLVARFDRRLCCSYVNHAVERMVGRSRTHLLGRTLADLELPPELARAWQSWLTEVLSSEQEEHFHVRHHTVCGLVAYEARVSPLRLSDGAVDSVLVVLRDVTKLVRAQHAAERAERLLAITAALSEALSVAETARVVLEQATSMLGAVAGGIYLLDRESQSLDLVQEVGSAGPHVDCVPLPLSSRLPVPDAVRSGLALWLDSPEEIATHYPQLVLQRHGEVGGMAAVPLVVEGRSLGGLSLTFACGRRLEPEDRDFCLAVARQCAQALDRARARDALRANETRFRRFVESNLIGVAFSDGGDALTDANDAFLEMLGYSREDVWAGRLRWQDLTPPEHPQRELHARCAPYEKEYLRKDGRRVPVLVGSAALDEAGTEWVCFVVDLSERERKDAELRKSRDQLDIILRGVVEGVIAEDVSGRLVFANEAAARNACFSSVGEMLALPPEAILERCDLLDEHGHPLAMDRLPVRLALAGQRPPETPMRLRVRATGEERWFVVNAVPVFDEAGAVRLALSIFHDVTALKEAERRITEESRSNELLRRIGESFASELDHPRLVQRIVDEATALTGATFGAFVQACSAEDEEPPVLSGEVSLGLTWYGRPEAIALVEAICQGRGGRRVDDAAAEPRFQPHGTGGPRSLLAVPVVSRSGRVLGGLFFGHLEPGRFTAAHERMLSGVAAQAAIALDNARLYREAQQAERRSAFLAEASALLATSLDFEASLRHLAQLAVPWLADWCEVVVAMEQGPTQVALVHLEPARMVLANEMQRRYPDDPDAPAGIPAVLRTGKPEFFPRVTDEMLKAVARGEEHLRLLREVRTRSVMMVPIMVRGTPVGVLTFATCDDGRRFTRSDLALAQSLADRAGMAVDNARHYHAAQEAVRVRDEFMSIASHELRTPLTPLRLQLNSLLRNLQTLPQPSPEVLGRLGNKVEAAVRQTNRLATLVNSLLDVTRISTGRLELNVEDMDLAALARDMVERFADELEDAGCDFTVRADLPVCGRWDRLRVEQVIANLLTNALKYGAGRPIEVEVTAREGNAVLRVVDHGIGIEPRDLDRIFERFERAVSSEAYGGLGLGLYITRCIVEAHGGQIQVESTPGSGSMFIVRLPPRTPAERPAPSRLQGPTGV